MKKLIIILTLLMVLFTAQTCRTDAEVASWNISQEAGAFKVNRRVIFYNGFTGEYVLVIEGRCQIDHGEVVSVTCKVGEDTYKKHYLRVAEHVTYFAEQLDKSEVDTYTYKVIFKPQTILPDIEVKIK